MAPETPVKYLIFNAKTVMQGNALVDTEILIDGQTIAGLGRPGSFRCENQLDAQGLLVIPGVIDAHVHFRDSGRANVGQSRKEDFGSGSKAAVAGGVTTFLDMPNTVPPTATATHYEDKKRSALKKSYADFGLYALAGRNNLADIPTMLSAGCIAVKLYMGQTTGSNLLADDTLEEKFFEASRIENFVLALHAEDQECLDEHAVLHRQDKVPKHNEVRPPECAALAVKRALAFAEKYQNATYFCHTSTAGEMEQISEMKRRGFPVFIEITPHHLFLEQSEQDAQGNRVKINPPLRSQKDRAALWKAMNDGTVDTIGTDHSPHLLEEKRQDYWDGPSGFPEIETALPLLMTAALEEKTTLETIQRLCCHNPARIFRLQGKGRLEKGFDADFVWVDLKTEKAVDESKLFTRPGWSPYAGRQLRGWPVKTFIRGRMVFDQGQHFGPFGCEVRKSTIANKE